MDIHTITRYTPRPLVDRIKYGVYTLKRVINKKKKVISSFQYLEIKSKGVHTFFGYYDVLPFNDKTSEIIFEEYSEGGNSAKVVLYDTESKQKKYLTESRAWNWQQGSRLRWMPDNSRIISFNDFDGCHYLCRMLNIDTGECRNIDYPLYDISSDGKLGLSLNFERLGVKRPGYGYTCREYQYKNEELKDEGIDLIDIHSNTSKRIITYLDISRALGISDISFEGNYLNHISFSPSGKSFLFFWLTIEDDGWHSADLMVYDFGSQQIKVLEKEKKVSHYVWIDDDTILCTAIDRDNTCRYYKYTISTGKRDMMVPDVLDRDGHPSYLGNNVILTDTYPDTNGYQNLYLVNLKTGTKETIMSIFNNCLINGERRTDLHPRALKGNSLISIDANPGRYRKLILINKSNLNV